VESASSDDDIRFRNLWGNNNVGARANTDKEEETSKKENPVALTEKNPVGVQYAGMNGVDENARSYAHALRDGRTIQDPI